MVSDPVHGAAIHGVGAGLNLSGIRPVAGLPLRSPKTSLPMGPHLMEVPHIFKAELKEYRQSLKETPGPN
jgi:hypothetical protein